MGVTVGKILKWIDGRHFVSVRSATLAVTIWMTWRVTVWAFEYARLALAAEANGVETAAVLGAVTIPLAALQGFAFNTYMKGKPDEDKSLMG
jgi:hypothetical protein